MERQRLFLSLFVIAILTVSLSCEDYDGDTENDWESEFLVSGAASTGDVYQAEARTAASGCTKKTNYAGYSGSGFMDFGPNGAWIEWKNVQADLSGPHKLTLRYANGKSGETTCQVLVNGKSAGQVRFKPTGAWKKWDYDRIAVTLKKGANTIRIKAISSYGGPNLDRMVVRYSGSGGEEPEDNCSNAECSSACPCGKGEGDCDKDSDCQSGLVCKQQSGTDFCVSSGGDATDPDNASDALKIVVFSVGSADSSLIVFPTGKTMQVDSATEGACEREVLPFLNRHGIKHLDYYLETHLHGDHIGGAPVLRKSGHIDSRTKKWDWKTHDYKDQFQLEKTQWVIANAWDKNLNGSGANENSVAFRLEYNGFVYSAGGDQYTNSQDRFLKDRPNLVQAHVRNTAHHMWGPVSKNFLVKTNPYIFITSCHSRGSLPSSFRSAVSTLEKSGRLRESVITGDANVGHVAIRASSKSNWDYQFCGKKSSCVIDYLP